MLTPPRADFATLREREFARLDEHDHAYLDYTGAALYAASQVDAHHAALGSTIYGNPHSEHEPSFQSSAEIAKAKAAVLAFFGVDERTHAVCFTANTTAAIKLVAESYPFGPQAPLILTADNHNSVNGLREFARRSSAPIATLPLDEALRLEDPAARLAVAARSGRGLFAFPAQSNFSGVQHPLSLIGATKEMGWDVLLDAAAFAPSNRLDLGAVPADFVTLSFYKLFGYPTGVGALIATRDALGRLRRPWFSGGTVDFVSIQLDRHQLRAGSEGFEDGTPDFLSVSAVPLGLAFLEGIGLDAVHRHVCARAHAFMNAITALRHRNGAPLVEVYGPGCAADRGATIAFNVVDERGRAIPYPIVETEARRAGISLRGGCFCNPGAAEAAFHFDPDRSAACLDRVEDRFSIERFASCLGDYATVGAMRASFGIPTNDRDVARAVELIASFAG